MEQAIFVGRLYFWLLNVFCDADIANAEGKAEAFTLKCIPKLFLQVATKGAALAVVFLPVDPFVVDTAFFEGADANDAGWCSKNEWMIIRDLLHDCLGSIGRHAVIQPNQESVAMGAIACEISNGC